MGLHGYKVGERVIAIRNADHGKRIVYVYGYGVYEGDFPFDAEAAGNTVDVARAAGRISNPRIRLDSGAVVWGAECWWGPEAGALDKFRGYAVESVDIVKDRAEWKAEADHEKEVKEVIAPRVASAARTLVERSSLKGMVHILDDGIHEVDVKNDGQPESVVYLVVGLIPMDSDGNIVADFVLPISEGPVS